MQSLLQEIMDAAVSIVEAEKGTLQLLEGDSLRIVASYGHNQPFLEFFASAESQASVCGEATRRGERVVVPDVETSSLFAGTPSLAVLREAGVRAVQSTPMLSRNGALLGILTTQWGVPYTPDDHGLWRIDLLVRQAADLIEHSIAEEALLKSRDELELRVQERTAELEKANRELFTEIEERKHAEEAVQTERKRLFDVLETLPAMICLLTPDYHVAFANRSFREKFGESHGRHCYEYCFGRPEPCDFCESYNVLKTGQPHHWEVTGTDGSVIDAYDFPFTDADGSPMILEMDIDITDWRRAEAELRSTMAKLEQSNQALQDFAYIAAHDMKEPLRKVISFGNMLRQKSSDSLGQPGNDYLDRMLNATERMQSLLAGLLDYSRVSTAAEPFKEVDLSDLVGEVISDLEVRISKTGGEVHVGVLPVVSADPTQMRQLFQNLIGNALKFHKPGEKPVVQVGSVSGTGSGCQIVVEDNGIGFDEQYLERIFAPFQRLHGRSEYEGTGMGLAICKKIVERHGGSITATSTPGTGARFVVRLPLR
jgi:signal transduction histidine kinase